MLKSLMLSYILNTTLDLIFPTTCYYCHRLGSDLCQSCEAKYFKIFNKSKCHICHGTLRVPGIYVHKICLRSSALDGLFATYTLNDPLKKYIGQIKYGYYRKMLEPLKLNIKQTLSNRSFSYDVISYVPLYIQRQRWRGFNQAEDIARTIDFKAMPLLNRVRSTKTQSLLNKRMRKINVKNSFKVINKELVMNRSILICDDVFTTGSTLNACGLALKQAGASKVYGYVLAIDELPADV